MNVKGPGSLLNQYVLEPVNIWKASRKGSIVQAPYFTGNKKLKMFQVQCKHRIILFRGSNCLGYHWSKTVCAANYIYGHITVQMGRYNYDASCYVSVTSLTISCSKRGMWSKCCSYMFPGKIMEFCASEMESSWSLNKKISMLKRIFFFRNFQTEILICSEEATNYPESISEIPF